MSRIFITLGLLLAVGLGLTAGGNQAQAQTMCTSHPIDPPNMADSTIHLMAMGLESPQCTGSSGALVFIEAPSFITGSPSQLFVVLPDADRPAPLLPVTIYRRDLEGNVDVSCPGAVVTGDDTTISTIELASGSCALKVSVTEGGVNYTYESTLTRNGVEYQLGAGTATGGFYGGVAVPNNPEVDIQRPAGPANSIADGGTDAQGNQDPGIATVVTYTIENVGGDVLNINNIVTNSFTNISSAIVAGGPFMINPGATAQFTITYTPTAAGPFSFDLLLTSNDADEGTYTITVSGTAVSGVGPDVAITVPERARGPYTATFAFSADVTGFELGDITVGNGTASNLAGGPSIYSATITPVSSGAPTSVVTVDVAANVAQDMNGYGNTAAAQATTTFIDERYVQTRTRAIINNFMALRADQITANDPDLAGRLASRNGSEAGIAGVGFSAEGTLANNHVEFATSLRQLFSAAERGKHKRRKELQTMMGLGQQNLGGQIDENGFDVWLQGTMARVESFTRNSDIGQLYVGADYRFGPSLLVGILAQYDWTDEDDSTQGFKVDGSGWLAGPYVVAKLSERITFDGRIAWGRSDNDISPFNTYTDQFDTTRLLTRGTLTGDFDVGGINISPHVGILYFEEDQKAYTDSLGVFIANQDVALGRVTFGPKVSTTFHAADGTVISPHIGIKGIWDFENPENVDLVTGLAVGTSDDLRARVDAGVAFGMTSGMTVTGNGFYDGIGADDLKAYGGSVNMKVPF